MAARPRFTVHRRPTKTPSVGNYAVVSKATGRIVGRSHSRANAQKSAATRGSAVRSARSARGVNPNRSR